MPQIGPRRAARILRYREQVADLAGINDLALAAGVGRSLAEGLAAQVDWRRPATPRAANILFSFGAVIACGLVFYYSPDMTEGIGLRPAVDMYATSLFLMLAASVAALASNAIRPLARVMALGSLCSVLAASVLFPALLLTLFATGANDRLATHVFDTGRFIAFGAIIIGLLYGPGWHVKSQLGHLSGFAIAFDYGQLTLPLATLVLVEPTRDPDLLSLLFAIWVSVALLFNGIEMARGKSSYVTSLSPLEQARLRFRLQEDESDSESRIPSRLLRPAGILLVLVSLTLLLVSIKALLG